MLSGARHGIDAGRQSIAAYEPRHRDGVVALSLRAWAPVFASLEQEMAPEVWAAFYPDGWMASQRKAVEDACAAPDIRVWVAATEEGAVGFVAVRIHDAVMGEIYMIAVEPSAQRRGIARALTEHALAFMREAGVSIAMVETGGDPGHAPARVTYESAGFRNLPLARYFRKL